MKSVDRVEVNWEAAYASSYRIQTSTDGTTYSDAANASRAGAGLEVTTFSARNARYVRLIADTRGTVYGVSFWDFRVFGPADPATDRHAPAGDDDHCGSQRKHDSHRRDASISARTRPPPRSSAGWTPASSPPARSPKAYTGLAPGSHTFEVRATDPAGNVDPTPATRTWTVTGPRQEATWR